MSILLTVHALRATETLSTSSLTNNYHMVGGATSVRIRKASQVSARLWLVVADFRSRPLRIEAEDNKLIREEAGGSDLFQCALPKPLVQASGFLAVQQFIRIIQDEPRSNAAITIITL